MQFWVLVKNKDQKKDNDFDMQNNNEQSQDNSGQNNQDQPNVIVNIKMLENVKIKM